MLDSLVERLIRADLWDKTNEPIIFVKTNLSILDRYPLREVSLIIEASSESSIIPDMPLFYEEYKVVYFHYYGKDNQHVVVYAYGPLHIFQEEEEYDQG